jgi:hypothetical protein
LAALSTEPSKQRLGRQRRLGRFYHYFADELGLDNFQVNTPFPGGLAGNVEGGFHLHNDELAKFLAGLFDVWIGRGYASGVSLDPFDALIHLRTCRDPRSENLAQSPSDRR